MRFSSCPESASGVPAPQPARPRERLGTVARAPRRGWGCGLTQLGAPPRRPSRLSPPSSPRGQPARGLGAREPCSPAGVCPAPHGLSSCLWTQKALHRKGVQSPLFQKALEAAPARGSSLWSQRRPAPVPPGLTSRSPWAPRGQLPFCSSLPAMEWAPRCSDWMGQSSGLLAGILTLKSS